jgi:hypothetical protein
MARRLVRLLPLCIFALDGESYVEAKCRFGVNLQRRPGSRFQVWGQASA